MKHCTYANTHIHICTFTYAKSMHECTPYPYEKLRKVRPLIPIMNLRNVIFFINEIGIILCRSFKKNLRNVSFGASLRLEYGLISSTTTDPIELC